MNPREILAQGRDLKLAQCRQVDDQYGEIVISTPDLPEWQKMLEGLLGQALKPAGCKPDAAHEALARSYGGIRKDQTLYHKKFENHDIVVLMWPWQDGASITLKVFLVVPKK